MAVFKNNPLPRPYYHVFGGHPVSAAASLALSEILKKKILINKK